MTDAAFSEVYDTLIDPVSAELPSSVYVYKFQFEGDVASMKTTVHWKFDGPMTGTNSQKVVFRSERQLLIIFFKGHSIWMI